MKDGPRNRPVRHETLEHASASAKLSHRTPSSASSVQPAANALFNISAGRISPLCPYAPDHLRDAGKRLGGRRQRRATRLAGRDKRVYPQTRALGQKETYPRGMKQATISSRGSGATPSARPADSSAAYAAQRTRRKSYPHRRPHSAGHADFDSVTHHEPPPA